MICEDPAKTPRCGPAYIATPSPTSRAICCRLADDLKQLPMPFLDPAVIQPLSIPIVFASAPSFKAIQAAGVVSSYFAISEPPVRFPVHIGLIRAGMRLSFGYSANLDGLEGGRGSEDDGNA